MNVIDGSVTDFRAFEKEFPEHASIIPAWAYSDVVTDYFHGPKSRIGVNLPWSKVNGSFGLRPGEVTIWAGTNGHGKSLVLNQIILQAMSEGETACIASFEMKPHITMARMTRQACGCSPPSEEFIRSFHGWTEDKLWLYDQQGTVKPERLLSVLRYCSLGLRRNGHLVGIKHFVIDSLMKCGIGVDDYNRQKSFVDQLCVHARDHNMHIHLVAHSRKADSEKRQMDKFDIKGASEITDQVDNVMTVWRNKGKEEEQLKPHPDAETLREPDAMVICSKQRHGEEEPKIALWFHKPSMQYLGSDGARPMQFFKFNAMDKEAIAERLAIQNE